MTQRLRKPRHAPLPVGGPRIFKPANRHANQPAYRKARRAAFSQSIARLQQASSAALSTLLKLMVDPQTPASTRVRAADSILNHTKQAIEIEDIQVRVDALEEAAKEE